jgi:hypothetical protein
MTGFFFGKVLHALFSFVQKNILMFQGFLWSVSEDTPLVAILFYHQFRIVLRRQLIKGSALKS